jgi:phage gp36-like protein
MSMPRYTTVDNVYSLYPRVGSLSTVTSASVAFFIDQAENEINAYLVNGYTLPFSGTPPIIESLSTEYSLVKILQRFFTQEVGSENSWVTQRAESVMDYLTKINSGDIGLFTSSLELIPFNAGDTIFSNTMNYNPTFTMLNPSLQQIDSDRLDDELDAVDNEDYNPSLY